MKPLLSAIALTLLLGGCAASESSSFPQDRDARSAEGSGPLQAVRARREGVVGLVGEKIIGGREALPGEAPWQVALVDGLVPDPVRDHFCGGSLISAQWVVTAAHCVDGGTRPRDLGVVTGTVDINAGGRRYQVAEIVIHPRYRAPDKNHDIALLRLSGEVAEGWVPLTTAAQDAGLRRGALLSVSGFGATYADGPMSPTLKIAAPPYVTNVDCNNRVAYAGRVSDNMLCAGRQVGGLDSCQGDSGGPLTAPGAQAHLVGVVSWGEGCAEPNKYGVYTRVARYTDWIAECEHDARRCRRVR